MDQTVDGSADSFEFLIGVEDNKGMEIAVADMTHNRRTQFRLCQVLFRLAYQLGEFGNRNAATSD